MVTDVVALSGGKDSTAMALKLKEVYPNRQFVYFCTPTGDEFPDWEEHIANLEDRLDAPIARQYAKMNLHQLIEHYNALPNWRQRWCTRQLKIEVAEAFYSQFTDPLVYVGLRADEDEREGVYSNKWTQEYPLRQWNWGIDEVLGYLRKKQVVVPERTDCMRCFFQTLGEWWNLWKQHPEVYRHAEHQELATGYTFRSPQRDSWQPGLTQLRWRFERGEIPPRTRVQDDLFGFKANRCMVCNM